MTRISGLFACVTLAACAGPTAYNPSHGADVWRTVAPDELGATPRDRFLLRALNMLRDAKELCASEDCRDAQALLLKSTQGTRESSVLQMPYVARDVVTVVPGDHFWVTGDVDGDRLVHLRLAKNDAKLRLEIEFRENDGAGPGMTLTLHSEYSQTLRYMAVMEVLGEAPPDANAREIRHDESFEYASTCPVLDRNPSSEPWESPIPVLLLGEFHYIRADDRRCE